MKGRPSLVERLGGKAARKVIDMKVPALRRWAPVVSTLILVVAVGARLAGSFGVLDTAAAENVAKGLESMGDVLGFTPDAELVAELGILTAAVTGAGAGVVMKIRSQVRKAKVARLDDVVSALKRIEK